MSLRETRFTMTLTKQNVEKLINARHENPAAILGLHAGADKFLTITTLQPQAESVEIIDKKTAKTIAVLEKVHADGLFSKKLRRKNRFRYQLKISQANNSYVVDDSFAFEPSLPEFDLHLLSEGSHQSPYNVLGAHLTEQQGVQGTSFSVWAPNASHVSIIGDFNDWDGRRHSMHNIGLSGFWQRFVPHVCAGNLYKFEIKDNLGNIVATKADPYGSAAQYRPDTASVVCKKNAPHWHDQQWMNNRSQRNAIDAPITIYEVHLGSWRRDQQNNFLNYRDIADLLIPYAVDMGFSHIQLMPVSEYPFDGSWGYQPVGLFAPTARFGSREDFQYFVDCCHQANIGLLIDWVPGHFPSDSHGLAQFDGTHLYEHADPRQGFHPDWNTLIYNYGRVEVANFLRASAMHWLDNYHIDGIRVDAVASMLYLDYSREHGQWIPNKFGGRENLEAVDFLQRFNSELYARFPGAFTVAEESTSWPGVSKPVDHGGLGFGFKWNMGWMNDSLAYMQRDPIHRQHHHNELSFGLVYAFDENFVLPLSHDEVVHGKGSILARMPGDTWQQFANLRAYYGFMWAHPGKKLLFMGCEFAQGAEWNHDQQLDWHQLDSHWHSGVQQLVKDLNQLYKTTPSLYQTDSERYGFSWLDHDNAEQSVYSFVRFDSNGQNPVIVVCNFTPQTHHNFRLGLPHAGVYQERLNTDAAIYGGSNIGNPNQLHSESMPWQNQPHSATITVPPLATVIFKWNGSV